MKRKHHIGFAALHLEINPESGEIQLTPAGSFRAIPTDGRPFEVDAWVINADIAAKVIERAAARANDIVIDYDHQTLRANENGQSAPAAGWFKKMEWREGQGLFAVDVRWTDKAKAHIAAKEYKYISPVMLYSKETGAVMQIMLVAITNHAAVDGMAEVAALAAATLSLNDNPEEPMNEKLLKLLGLKKDATDDAALAALTALVEKADKAETSATEVAALTTQVADLTAKGDKPDPAKFVPVETVKELQTQVADLSAKISGKDVDELVTAALTAGKLLPAQEKWARDLGNSDIAALTAFIKDAPSIAALGGTQTGGNKPGDVGKGGEVQGGALAVCTALGVDPEEFKKTREALISA